MEPIQVDLVEVLNLELSKYKAALQAETEKRIRAETLVDLLTARLQAADVKQLEETSDG